MMNDTTAAWLITNGFIESATYPNLYKRTLTAIAEVAFHGKMESRLEVSIAVRSEASGEWYTVSFHKNDQPLKRKSYFHGWQRAKNAITQTIEYHGFSLALPEPTVCPHYEPDTELIEELDAYERYHRETYGDEAWEEYVAWGEGETDPDAPDPYENCGECCKHSGTAKGYPGETLHVCHKTMKVFGCDFDIAAVI